MKLVRPSSVIGRLFDRHGHNGYAGEVVNLIFHACQTAALLMKWGWPEWVVVAGLLHDLGELAILDLGHKDHIKVHTEQRHELMAVVWMLQNTPTMPVRVQRAVMMHVIMKIILADKVPGYARGLSPASKRSLALQRRAGRIREVNLADLTRHPDFMAMLAVRVADDLAKDPNADVPPLESYFAMIDRVAA